MNKNLELMYAGKNLHNLTINYVSNGIVDKWGGKRRKYKVTLSTDFGKVSFAYYDSVENYSNGKKKLNIDDLHEALSSFLYDCFCHLSGDYGLPQNTPSTEVASIKRECRREYMGLVEIVGGNEDTFGDFISAINKTIFNID